MTQFNTKRASLDTLSPEDICAVMKFENTMMDYNQKKNDTIQKIYAKLFAHLQKNS
ncbi:TPA: hypothetical protein ACKRT6_000434 [Providencia stuartii]